MISSDQILHIRYDGVADAVLFHLAEDKGPHSINVQQYLKPADIECVGYELIEHTIEMLRRRADEIKRDQSASTVTQILNNDLRRLPKDEVYILAGPQARLVWPQYQAVPVPSPPKFMETFSLKDADEIQTFAKNHSCLVNVRYDGALEFSKIEVKDLVITLRNDISTIQQ